MKLTNLAAAIQIFLKYADDSDLEAMRAEHDEIFIGDTSWPITDEDKATLDGLGFIPCDEGCYHAWT